MTREFENEPTDDELDAMLRDVAIPGDLKARLNQIPESTAIPDANVSLPQVESGSRASWIKYALVASLLTVTAFATAHFFLKDDGPIALNDPQDPKTLINRPAPRNLETESTNQQDQLTIQDQELLALEAQVREFEIARLESELLRMETDNRQELSQNEVDSIIMAMAPEHSIFLGGEADHVRTELARVLREYPDTRGAVLANNILDQLN